MKSPRSLDSYRKLLGELLQSLKLSSTSYDKGYYGESKRLACVARVLLHDTSKSTSVLHQIGVKSQVNFVGTPLPSHLSTNLLSQCDLVMTRVGSASEYLPILDDFPPVFSWTKQSFDDWWNTNVLERENLKFSRKDLCLLMANKEGGAHVDPDLDENYRKLEEENLFGWTLVTNGVTQPIASSVHYACMRQIAHELSLTFHRNERIIERALSRIP